MKHSKKQLTFILPSICILAAGMYFFTTVFNIPIQNGSRGPASAEDENLICEDLFDAACENYSSDFPESMANEVEKNNSKINEIQTQAISAMGFQSYDEALVDRLRKSGITSAEIVPGAGISIAPLPGVGPGSDCSNATLTSSNSEEHQKLINTYLQRNPIELAGYIRERCKPDTFLSSNVDCGDVSAVRRQVSDILRLEGEARNVEAANFFNQYKSMLAPAGDTDSRSNTCSFASHLQSKSIERVQNDLNVEINTSQTFVTGVMDHYYSPRNVDRAQRTFSSINNDFKELMREIAPNSQGLNSLESTVSNTEFVIPRRPVESDYFVNSNGVKVLKENFKEIIPANNMIGSVYSNFSNFFDPRSSFFQGYNGIYRGNLVIDSSGGLVNSGPTIFLYPSYLSIMDANLETSYSVLSHEVGHSISPLNANHQGYGGLLSKFQPLFDCYSEGESIAMTEAQKNEVIADYISSELMNKRLSRIPNRRKRRELLLKSVQNLCNYELEHEMHGLLGSDAYPDNFHRCSGIYGANANLRETIGCEGRSTRYKNCSLEIGNSSNNDMPAQVISEGAIQ